MSALQKTKKDVVTEFRHAEILDAARTVFAKRGYRAACVDQIAQQAGLAKGTLYLYYKSKQELYWATLREGLKELGQELERKVGAARGPREKIHAYVSTKVSHVERHKEFVRIYYAEVGNAAVNAAVPLRDFKEYYQQQVSVLRSALREAAREGSIRKVREEAAAYAIFDVTRGVIMRRLLGWTRTRPEDDVERVVDLAWRGLVPR
jgi:AcrR family transcriptional regulator